MNDSLEYCYNNRRVVSVYRDRDDTERHLTGYVARLNDSDVLIAHITPNGLYDGFILLHANTVFRVDHGGKYEDMIEKLYNLRGQSHPTIDTFDEENDQIFFSILDYAIKHDLVVSICFSDNYISGTVKSYSDNFVFLDLLDDFGDSNGSTAVNIDDILSILVDSEENQAIDLLRKNK